MRITRTNIHFIGIGKGIESGEVFRNKEEECYFYSNNWKSISGLAVAVRGDHTRDAYIRHQQAPPEQTDYMPAGMKVAGSTGRGNVAIGLRLRHKSPLPL